MEQRKLPRKYIVQKGLQMKQNSDGCHVEIRPLSNEHIAEVTKLHIQGITGFISSLGEKFTQYIYQAILESDHAFGFVAICDGDIVGFVACAQNLSQVYKSIIRRHSFGLACLLLPKMFRPTNIRDAIEVLLYPKRRASAGLPSAEMLAITLAEQSRGMGIGRKLVDLSLEEFRNRGIEKVKVLVGEEIAANGFYEHLGFQLVDQYWHHAKLLNTYVRQTGST